MNPYPEIRERVSVSGGKLVWSRPWTDEERRKAILMRRMGVGSTAIARKLRRTRNSVIGALHRAGEEGFLINQFDGDNGRWSTVDRPARPLPMRFSEQANG